jgi:hypothetical protein
MARPECRSQISSFVSKPFSIQTIGKDVPQGLKSLRENPLCRPRSGLDLREIFPGTPVPGYRLSRPFGTDCVGTCGSFLHP